MMSFLLANYQNRSCTRLSLPRIKTKLRGWAQESKGDNNLSRMSLMLVVKNLNMENLNFPNEPTKVKTDPKFSPK